MSRAQHVVLLSFSMAFAVCSVKAQTPGGLIRRTPETAEETKRAERLITLDVQVTDRSGKSSNGLGQQSFNLLDNGHPQRITSFQRIEEKDEASSVEVVLVLDTMNASFQDVVIERQGIQKFLLKDGGQLALPVSIVFVADTGVQISKPSKDGRSLAADLEKLQTPMRVLGSAQGEHGAQDRSQRSLRALQMLCTYEATRRGRKLLVWVGPGWPLLSRSTAEPSERDHRRYFNSIVDVTTALRRAHITLYSVVPLNLAQVGGGNPLLYQSYLKGVEDPSQADSTHLALQVLAIHSGGRVLGQSGDLAGQIALCVEDGQGYYEITFDAAESDAAIQYHALQINIDQPGAVTRTSSAYYAGVPQSTAVETSHSPAALSTTAPAPQVLKAEAHLVLVDVTALDKKGQPIKGLSATDFLLREDNAPQTILSLEEHSASDHVVAAVPTDATTKGTVVVNNKPPSGSAWNVLLIDLYNTPNEDRGRLQSQLEQFLKQLPEQESVALVTMSSHIKIETLFQDGAGAAYRYLRKHGLGPVDSTPPANNLDRQDPLMPSADIEGTAVANQANVDVDRQANRAQTTLDCFSALAQWLAPYPGKKNVYWLSAGFPLQGQPFGVDTYNSGSPGLGRDTKGGHPIPMQQQTDKQLQSARVTIYPVDARGVAASNVEGVTSADTTFTANVAIARGKDEDLSTARRSEMLEIAKATGGVAQFNNDIPKVLRDDFNQADSYYTIAYTPPDKEWKGTYHRIQISTDTSGAQLVHREGYYAKDADNGARSTSDQFLQALRLGAPAEMAVQFTSKVTQSGDAAVVESAVEPKTIDFQQETQGSYLTDVDFAILEYDSRGKVLEKSVIKLSGKMTPTQMAHLSAKTLSTTQTIKCTGGAKTLVLGVRDNVSGRFGKIEVSLSNH
jgi:VWFA-related protein